MRIPIQRTLFLILFFTFFSVSFVEAQYPFESYSSPNYTMHRDWKIYDRIDTKGRYDCTLSIDHFFSNEDKLTIQLTWLEKTTAMGEIRVFRNKSQIQNIKRPGSFSPLTMNGTLVIVSDINGDGLKDVKLVHQGTGNGIMGMLVKVMYLFQREDGLFKKVSFYDMMIDENRVERDVDNDGNYEIVTMNLERTNAHSYWAFNVFEYDDGNLINVNYKINYPILIQYKYKRNYNITEHMSRSQMKLYEREFPDEYDVK
ncbi:hypothetical protein [Aquimarina algiphila]|uniref:hypothetical protein n=1 Tax=Aquimarina algiphila TaxID=2047982 RepID=UPI00232C0135|nr:hypothetical protein [Aquimarina algiphila]